MDDVDSAAMFSRGFVVRLPARFLCSLLGAAAIVACAARPAGGAPGAGAATPAVPLFPRDGEPAGFVVRHWADVRDPPPAGARWTVRDGVLHGGEPRGTWLLSERDYGDFELSFEWKLDARGNSGCALRAPPHGDPAFDGLELQMVDPAYYPPGQQVGAAELTGALYKAVAPRAQVYRAGEWNRYVVRCQGPRVRVELNGVEILDVDLEEHREPVARHDGRPAPALAGRPRSGRIGFQELGRGGGHVQIRNAVLREL